MLKTIWPFCVIYALSVFTVLAKTEHNTGELCYLADGGSSQTFLVNEASPVNTIIGNIQVIGRVRNNSELADIELSIERVELSGAIHSDETILIVSPVRIENGSKQLILNRPLDREAPEGESGITVHIKCSRLLSELDQQPIYIPIRIIITDANDHTPVFINTPYIANVSELVPLYSQILPAGVVRAIDNDQEGPFSTVQYSILPGPYNHMVAFESSLGGALLLNLQLDYETLPKFWIEICASDQGEPPRQATTKLVVNVIDADDQNPHFLDEKYSCYWDETYKINDTILVYPRQIKAIDPDTNINAPIEYQFNTLALDEQPIFNLDAEKGILTLTKLLNSEHQLPRTYVLKAVQTDNPDRYALTTLTVFKRKNLDGSSSSNDKLHFIASSYSASVLENLPAGQNILNIQVQPSSNAAHQSIKYQILDNDQSHFIIKDNGQILLNKPLDFESKKFHFLRVLATDGIQSDICRINITVLNVNDHNPSFAQPYYNFFVPENKLHPNTIIGQLKVTDEDSMDEIKLSLKGPFSNWFTISDDGILRIRTLNDINTTQCHLIVQASDTGSPPRTSSVPVTVQLPTTILSKKSFIQSTSSSTMNFGRFDISKQELNEENGLQETALLDVNSILSSNGSSSALILVIVLGVLLATLFIIIITLTVHVLKQRRFSSDTVCSASADSGCSQRSESHSPDIQLSFQHQLFAGTNFDTHLLPTNDRSGTIRRISYSSTSNHLNNLIPGLDNPVFNSTTTNVPTIISNNSKMLRNESDSAIVSDVSSNEGRSVTGTLLNQTIRSHPPPPSSILASNANGLIWSQQHGSIPRRVKKLTWEDEKFGGFGSTSIICSGTERLLNSSNGYELDPDVSVTPIHKTMLHQHGDKSKLPDCTVYF